MTQGGESQVGAVRRDVIALSRLDPILSEFKGDKGAVIVILQRAQDAYGYLPSTVLHAIARRTRIPISRLFGVATFYAQFRLTRRGRHLVRICDGTACHVRGAGKAIESLAQTTGVHPGQTSADGRYTLEVVYCLGSCGLSPVALVDDRVLGRLGPHDVLRRLDDLD